MKTRPLIIGPREVQRIEALVAYANANRFSFEQLVRIKEKLDSPAGDNPHFVVLIPVGFRCVFTIEKQPRGWTRHLSVSVLNSPGRCPNPLAVDELMKHFGFRPTPSEHLMWIEDEIPAVNLVEYLEKEK